MYGYIKAIFLTGAFTLAIAITPFVGAEASQYQYNTSEQYISYPYRPYYSDNRRPRYYRPYRYYKNHYYPRYYDGYYRDYRDYRYYDSYPYYQDNYNRGYYYGPRGGFQIRFRT